jgi:hypothetical protein
MARDPKALIGWCKPEGEHPTEGRIRLFRTKTQRHEEAAPILFVSLCLRANQKIEAASPRNNGRLTFT